MAGEFPDPSAAQRFRDGIAFAMEMGAPPEEERQVTFLFAPQLVYNRPTDESGLPFDPTATVTEEAVPPVRVPCAVQFYDSRGQVTELGILSPTRVEITLLDEHYELVKDAIAVVIDGDRFNYRKTEPPSGLFSVGLYVLHFDAEDDK